MATIDRVSVAAPATLFTPTGVLTEARLGGIVGYQLAQASVLTSQVFQQQVGMPFELRPFEYTLLTLIGDNPGAASSSLAQALAVTAPNITMAIDRLSERGLVRRRQSSTDRRKQELRLSAEGTRLVASATERLLAGERAALVALSGAEQAMLLELLQKVARSHPPLDQQLAASL
jgi:DNA-binding MarR family transcriptional regulator